jgi:tetratricopeptide (TPR) repeat protein
MQFAPVADTRRSLEQFRHLLFHLQMECGSIHHIFSFFKEEASFKHFDALKAIDPNLMPQLLAREHVLEARRSNSPETALVHLQTALQLDPQCPEACLELAGLADSPESAMMWYQRSMDATAKLLGPEMMEELIQDFKLNPWKQVETHTWFKAKVSLSEKLFRNGYYETAAVHFREMLELNPADDLELRPYLLTSLLCDNRLEDARALVEKYPDDGSAKWLFLRAFLRYKEQGDTRISRRSLTRALHRNLWVSVFLIGAEEMPPSHLVERRKNKGFKSGSRLEAADCVKCIGLAFCEDSRLQGWVWEVLKEKMKEEV